MEPSSFNFVLKIHLDPTTFALFGFGIRDQVLFCARMHSFFLPWQSSNKELVVYLYIIWAPLLVCYLGRLSFGVVLSCSEFHDVDQGVMERIIVECLSCDHSMGVLIWFK